MRESSNYVNLLFPFLLRKGGAKVTTFLNLKIRGTEGVNGCISGVPIGCFNIIKEDIIH